MRPLSVQAAHPLAQGRPLDLREESPRRSDAGRGTAAAPWCLPKIKWCHCPLAVQVERGILVRSSHARREENMWCFAQAALDLLAECVAEAEAGAEAAGVEAGAGADAAAGTSSSSSSSAARPPPPPPPLLLVSEDRYGGVEVSVREGGEHEVSDFVAELYSYAPSVQPPGIRPVSPCTRPATL